MRDSALCVILSSIESRPNLFALTVKVHTSDETIVVTSLLLSSNTVRLISRNQPERVPQDDPYLSEFIHALQQRKWTVDTNLDHDHLHDVLPSSKPSTEAASQVDRDSGEGDEDDSDGVPKSKGPAPFPGNISPRMLWDLKRALIVKTSHVGQHKFAGNVIVSELASFALTITDQALSPLLLPHFLLGYRS